MANYEAGTAFVQIVPSMANFHRAIKKVLRGLADEVELPIDSGALNSSAEILSRITRDMEHRVLAEFPNITPPDVTVNTAPARDEVQRLQRDISRTTAVIGVRADTVRTVADTGREWARQRTASVRGETDIARIRGEIDAIRARTPPLEVPVDADLARAEAKIRELTAKKSTIEVEFLADTRDLDAQITELRHQLDAQLAAMDADIAVASRERDVLDARRQGGADVGPELARAQARLDQLQARRRGIEIDVNLDIQRAEAQLARLAAEHDRMRIQVDADTALAQAQLAQVGQHSSGASFGAEDAERAVSMVALLTAGLSTLGAVAPAAAASVAAVPAALLGAGQVVGVFVASLNGVADAVSAMDTVRVDNLTGAGATATQIDTMRDALAGLTPAGREFAQFVSGEMLPAMRGMGDAVQATLLPRLEDALRRLGAAGPQTQAALEATATAIGASATTVATRVTSPVWIADLELIASTNTRLIPSLTSAGIAVADMFRSLSAAAMPAIDRITQWVETQALLANGFIQTARASGQLGVWFGHAADVLMELAGIVAQISTGIGQLLAALAPLGLAIAHTVANVVAAIGAFAAAHPALTRLIGAALIAVGAFVALGRGIAGLGKALTSAVSGWRALLGPMTAAGARTVAAGAAAHTTTTALAANATAGDRSSSAMGRVAAGFGRVVGVGAIVGTVLGGAALAFDGLTTSADEAATALLRGGRAAQQATQSVRDQQVGSGVLQGLLDFTVGQDGILPLPIPGFQDWIRNLSPSMDQVRARAHEMYRAMTPLQQAQTDLTQAQNDYALAVQRQGPASDAAAAAQQRVAAASNHVERAQARAAAATKSHTDRMVEQQAQAISALDRDLALRQALAAVTQAQRQAATATRQHGRGSTQASTANLQLEQSMLRAAQAARDKAAASNQDVGATQRDQLANAAFNRTLARLVLQAGGAAPLALRLYLAGLNSTALGAINARKRTDQFGNAVLVLPGNKIVHLGVRGDIEAQKRIAALRNIINTLPDHHWFTVYARTVQTAIQPPAPDPNAPPVPLPPLKPQAHGGIMRAFATGAIASDLTPMRPIAQVVPPRTWRVVGDRMRGDEAYIPINTSTRSQHILAETARRMGFGLTSTAHPSAGMDSGGLMSPSAAYTRAPRPQRSLPRDRREIAGPTSAPQITVNARTDASPEHIAHVVNRHLRIQSRL